MTERQTQSRRPPDTRRKDPPSKTAGAVAEQTNTFSVSPFFGLYRNATLLLILPPPLSVPTAAFPQHVAKRCGSNPAAPGRPGTWHSRQQQSNRRAGCPVPWEDQRYLRCFAYSSSHPSSEPPAIMFGSSWRQRLLSACFVVNQLPIIVRLAGARLSDPHLYHSARLSRMASTS